MAPIYRGEIVCDDINQHFKELQNENVKENEHNQLSVWDRIFKRILEPDGVQYLHKNIKFRFNMKTRAYDALAYPGHSAGMTGELVLDVIEQIEHFGLPPNEIVVGKKYL